MPGAVSKYVVALDVGGATVKSAVLDAPGRLAGEPLHTPIDSGADAATILGTLAGIIRQQVADIDPARLAGVGIGFPGPFDYEAGISYIHGLEKYEAIYSLNVRDALRDALRDVVRGGDMPILFRNDAEAAIIGEARHGAGRPYRRLIGVTLGTGMGSSFVVDGVRVAEGPGVPPDGWLFPELFRGERVDDVFSTRGLAARLQAEGAEAGSPKGAAAAARQGDVPARRVFEQFGADLGAFLSPYALAFGAEAILVLGGISNAFDLFGQGMAQALPVPVRKTELGVRAGLIGAGELLYRA